MRAEFSPASQSSALIAFRTTLKSKANSSMLRFEAGQHKRHSQTAGDRGPVHGPMLEAVAQSVVDVIPAQ